MPLYGWVGLAVLLVSEAGTLARIEPFWTWHTAVAWTAYILLVDAIVWNRCGSSWIRSAPAEFAFLAILSIRSGSCSSATTPSSTAGTT